MREAWTVKSRGTDFGAPLLTKDGPRATRTRACLRRVCRTVRPGRGARSHEASYSLTATAGGATRCKAGIQTVSRRCCFKKHFRDTPGGLRRAGPEPRFPRAEHPPTPEEPPPCSRSSHMQWRRGRQEGPAGRESRAVRRVLQPRRHGRPSKRPGSCLVRSERLDGASLDVTALPAASRPHQRE